MGNGVWTRRWLENMVLNNLGLWFHWDLKSSEAKAGCTEGCVLSQVLSKIWQSIISTAGHGRQLTDDDNVFVWGLLHLQHFLVE